MCWLEVAVAPLPLPAVCCPVACCHQAMSPHCLRCLKLCVIHRRSSSLQTWANFTHLTQSQFSMYFSHGTSKFCPLWPTVLFTFVSEILSINSSENLNLVEILTIDRLRAAGECEPVMTSSSCCDDVTLVCSLQKYRHHHITTVLCPGRKSFINLKYSCIQCTGRSVTEMDVLYIQNFLDFFQPTVRLSRYFGGLVVSRGAWVRGL